MKPRVLMLLPRVLMLLFMDIVLNNGGNILSSIFKCLGFSKMSRTNEESILCLYWASPKCLVPMERVFFVYIGLPQNVSYQWREYSLFILGSPKMSRTNVESILCLYWAPPKCLVPMERVFFVYIGLPQNVSYQ